MLPSRSARNPKRTRILGATALAVLAVAATACGSSSSGASSPKPADTAAVSTCMTATATGVQEAKTAPTLQLPSTPPALSKVKGKELWFISPSQAFQIILEESEAFSAAAKAAGMTPVIFNGNSSVQQWNVGITQAVARHAGAIVLVAIDPKLVSGPLQKAVAAGIPVIDTNNGSAQDALTSGLRAHVETNVIQDGTWMADYALQKGGCTGQYGVFYTSVYPGLRETKGGVGAEVAKQCSSCSTVVQDTPSADVQTKVGPAVQTMVHSHPDMKMVMALSDAQALFMVPALQQIQSKVQIVGADGTGPNIQFIKNGQVEVGSVLWGPSDLLGYEIVDEMARLAAGQPAVAEQYPSRLVTTENIGDPSTIWASLGDYVGAYKALWAKG